MAGRNMPCRELAGKADIVRGDILHHLRSGIAHAVMTIPKDRQIVAVISPMAVATGTYAPISRTRIPLSTNEVMDIPFNATMRRKFRDVANETLACAFWTIEPPGELVPVKSSRMPNSVPLETNRLRMPLRTGATAWMLLFLMVFLPGLKAKTETRPGTEGARTQAFAILRDRHPGSSRDKVHDKCGLHVVADALRERGSLTGPQRAALAILQTRPSLQTSLVQGGFCVHFDTSGINTPALLDSLYQRIPGTATAYADSVASIASYVYTYITSILGFAAPPSDGGLGGGPEFDIYIEDLGPDLYGQTTPDVDVVNGGTSSSFIEIHNDFTFVNPPEHRGLPAMRVTLAHEFTHAVTVGSYGFWLSDIWFHEVTATWMEDVVYHGINDYLNYLFSSESQFQTPDVPLPTNDVIYYSRAIWGKYLAKRFGRDVMLHIWQTARGMAPIPATDYTLRTEYASNLAAAFSEWTLWNYFTGSRADTVRYYDEGRLFPVIAETPYMLNVPAQQVTGMLQCLSGSYSAFLTGNDTVTVALANINTSCSSDATSPLAYSYTVAGSGPGDGYRAIAGGLFLSLSVADPSQWAVWDIDRSGAAVPRVTENKPYPSPFRPGNGGAVYLPTAEDEANVAIYSSGMELVYHNHQQAISHLGESVFVWDGRTNAGAAVPSGVYVYVLNTGGHLQTGKIAVVR